jgi:hypothetical protein
MIRPLSIIKHCFDSSIPSGLATCSQAGIPNVTYISKVHLIDDRHVGLSYQFFNKTKKNIVENPYASLLQIDMFGVQYRLSMRYERTEFDGPIFDKIKTKLDAVASMSGMSDIFQLKGVDIYQVTDWQCMEANVPVATPGRVETFEDLNTITHAISACDQLSTLLDTTLLELHKLGYSNSMVLLRNPDGHSLYAIASHGYEQQGAGAEVKLGEGIIGIAGSQQKPVTIANMRRENIMADAIRHQAINEESGRVFQPRIPLPGLARPNSQMAVPIEARGRLLGVLFLESEHDPGFTQDTESFIGSVANHLGTAMLLCDDETAGASDTEMPASGRQQTSSSGAQIKIRYYRADKSIFVDNDYLIKGVAGAILWRLLDIFQTQGRSEFTNRELRVDPELHLPEVADNLEARLVLLKRRLDDKCSAIKMEKTGRGRFKLLITCQLDTMLIPPA